MLDRLSLGRKSPFASSNAGVPFVVAWAWVSLASACGGGTATLPPDEPDASVGDSGLPVACTPGESRPSDDGCNTCVCVDTGRDWACTKRACPKPGPDAGPPCVQGERRLAADGCNTCVCSGDAWSCTDRACARDGGAVRDGGNTSCNGPGSCVIVAKTCCGQCGAATPQDHLALSRAAASTYRQSICGPTQGCPACAADDVTTGAMQARCVAGGCESIHVPTDPISACSRDEDCTVRWADCCNGGGPGVVAIRFDRGAEYQGLVCPASPGCGNAPPTPMPYRAACDKATRHCAAVRP